MNNERWRIYTEQQEKENQAQIAAQAKQARRMFLRRGITNAVLKLLMFLVPLVGMWLLLLTIYNSFHQTPAEILADHVRSRMEQGMGQCGKIVEPITIWYDKPDGESSAVFTVGTRVVRIGETWDSWPFPDHWVKVRASPPERGVFIAGWVDERDLIACSASLPPSGRAN